jgi:hypothetical protein
MKQAMPCTTWDILAPKTVQDIKQAIAMQNTFKYTTVMIVPMETATVSGKVARATARINRL